jgi:hypothetical protein
VRICPSNPFLSAMALVVLALSMTPAPALGADSAKSAAAAPEIKADLVLSSPASSPIWWCSTGTSSPSTQTRSPKRRFS